MPPIADELHLFAIQRLKEMGFDLRSAWQFSFATGFFSFSISKRARSTSTFSSRLFLFQEEAALSRRQRFTEKIVRDKIRLKFKTEIDNEKNE